MKKHQVEIKWQAVVFGVYFIVSLLVAYSEHPREGIYGSEIFNIILVIISECILVNFIGNWLMVKHPYSKNKLLYIGYLALCLLAYLLFRYITVFPNKLDIANTYKGDQDESTLSFFFFYSYVNSSITYILAYGLYAIKKSLRVERHSKMLEAEINEAKLAILKNQINPHFLYNTLSYMYAQARPVSENLSKSILLLSDMMRYSISKTDDKGLTPLENEIQYIQNFIEIHRLRFDEDFYLDFEIEGVFGNKKIVPLLLITFVENAIKHGMVNDAQNPIKIELSIVGDQLTMLVKNQKQMGIKDDSSGIGLENTKKRLALAYPDNHTIEITDKPSYFWVNLKITLDGD